MSSQSFVVAFPRSIGILLCSFETVPFVRPLAAAATRSILGHHSTVVLRFFRVGLWRNHRQILTKWHRGGEFKNSRQRFEISRPQDNLLGGGEGADDVVRRELPPDVIASATASV